MTPREKFTESMYELAANSYHGDDVDDQICDLIAEAVTTEIIIEELRESLVKIIDERLAEYSDKQYGKGELRAIVDRIDKLLLQSKEE